MSFGEPIWILVGVVVCAGLAWLVAWAGRKRRVALEAFASRRLLGGLTAGVSEARRRGKAWLLIGGMACLFLALARPQWGTRFEEVTRRGIDILLAVDTSRSMLAPDVAPDRLGRAKLGIYDFVQKLEGDRVGLMPFAGQAFLLCPLTLDYGAFGESLQAVDTSIVPEGGTDIALAIRTAEKAFEKGSNHKILVLITDGEDLEGEALEAAKSAAENGVTIHTVGVGTPNGELIPVKGEGGFVKDAEGNAVKSRLDEAALEEVAALTGGVYAALGDRGEGLATIYREKLALVPEEELSQRMKEVKMERFQWPLGLGVLLLVAEYLVRVGKRREVAVGVGAKGAVAGLAVLLVGMSGEVRAADDARVVYNEGTAKYEAGDWEGAEAGFRGALETGDVGLQNRAYYNLGNTLYRKGEVALQGDGGKEATVAAWEAAVEAYDNALALDAEDGDAAFNKEFVEKKLEELKQEEEQQEQEDEQDQEQEKEEEQQEEEQKENEQGSGEENQENEGDKGDENEEQQGEGGEQEGEKEDAGTRGHEDAEKEDGKGEENQDQKGEEEQKENGGEQEGEKEDAGTRGHEDAEKEDGKEGQQAKEAGEGQEEDAGTGGRGDAGRDGEREAGEKPQDQEARPAQGAERVPGEMSREEAVQLLQSMLDEEGEFKAMPYSLMGERERSTGRVKRDW